jgi:hypothetical protein
MTEEAEKGIGPPRGIRRGALWALFSMVLLIPKILALRRQARIWNAARMAALVFGLAVILAAYSVPGHFVRTIAIAAGALVAALALVISPEKSPRSSRSPDVIDARARALGALVVVDGGRYLQPDGRLVEAHLFVGSDRLCVLDATLTTLIEIPIAQILAARAEPAARPGSNPHDDKWKLRVTWASAAAEFLYAGPFAEHLARVAESTIGSQLRRELPVLP